MQAKRGDEGRSRDSRQEQETGVARARAEPPVERLHRRQLFSRVSRKMAHRLLLSVSDTTCVTEMSSNP